MKVEVFSDKFVTKGNPNGRAVVDTDDPKARKLLGEKVIAELVGGGDGVADTGAAPAAASSAAKKRKTR